jgi:hypothetical protein
MINRRTTIYRGSGGDMTLTREKIEAGMTGGRGITQKQCDILGVSYEKPCKLKKGWKNRLIGVDISQETYDRFVDAGKEKKPDIKRDTFTITMLKTEGLRLYRAILAITSGKVVLSESQSWGMELLLNKLDKEFSEK